MAITLDSVGGFILNLVLMVLGIVVLLGTATGVFFWVKHSRRYKEFVCVIWERDGFGQLKQSYDRGGIFVDAKTKNKRLYLRKHKVSLNPDKIPYLQSDKTKTIYLLKTGLKNFHFINVNIKEPLVTLTVGEEDVNWAINSYEREKKLFSAGLLMQLMPYISLAFVSIIILILFIYFFKQFTVLADMATSLKEAAQIIAQARVGTIVIPS